MESTAAVPRLQAPTTALRGSVADDAVEDSSRIDDGDLNRAERIGFWVYVAMAIFCTVVVVAAATSAIVT